MHLFSSLSIFGFQIWLFVTYFFTLWRFVFHSQSYWHFFFFCTIPFLRHSLFPSFETNVLSESFSRAILVFRGSKHCVSRFLEFHFAHISPNIYAHQSFGSQIEVHQILNAFYIHHWFVLYAHATITYIPGLIHVQSDTAACGPFYCDVAAEYAHPHPWWQLPGLCTLVFSSLSILLMVSKYGHHTDMNLFQKTTSVTARSTQS